MSQFFSHRLLALQQQLQPSALFLLTDAQDIFYFTGFQTLVPEEREAFLLVTPSDAYLFHASFSPLPPGIAIKTIAGAYPAQLVAHLTQLQSQKSFTEMYIDKTKLYADEFEALQQIPNCALKTLNKSVIWQLRMVKDETEIAKTITASDIAVQAFAELVPQVTTGMTEIQVQDLLEGLMRQGGSRQVAFPTIVAFGAHGALPHHQPGDTRLEENQAILIDFGAAYQGYRSDVTRSWWHGNHPDPDFLKIEKIVKDAYAAVRNEYQKAKKSQPEVTAAHLDFSARDLIVRAGFGPQFIHTTGHGVGLEIHEQPSLNPRNQTIIRENMLLTVEPGIYLPGKFGYRYENTVLVLPDRLQELTLANSKSK